MALNTQQLIKELVDGGISPRAAELLAGVLAPTSDVPNQLSPAADRQTKIDGGNAAGS